MALVYVKLGQEDERSILGNSRPDCSPAFLDFVSSLGWEVDLATHPGFMGGLERNLTTGTTALYYCTSTLELLFHDATLMPSDSSSDGDMLKKKRHIGNDHVHIIWSEHHRSYARDTISGDFGSVQIVISPLHLNANAFYAVEVRKDGRLPFGGPLLNHAVVPRHLLGPMVRATAVHAHRMVMQVSHLNNMNGKQPAVVHPYGHRLTDLDTIVARYRIDAKRPVDFEHFAHQLVFDQ